MLRRPDASRPLAGRARRRPALRSGPAVSAAPTAPVSLSPAEPFPVRPDPPSRTARVERPVATIPARFRGRARRDAAAFYLSQLAKGVLGGEIAVGTGERPTTLATSEFVILEIEARQKKRANHVTVKLRWPKRPLIRAGIPGRNVHG
jgi:amphi-Trp domain-containing protein